MPETSSDSTSAPADPRVRPLDPGEHGSATQLGDGTPLVVRPIRPDDKPALETGLDRLSKDSVYTRFFGPKMELTESELAYLTEVDFHDHVALVATLPEADHRLVGVGRYVVLEEDQADGEPTAELAITVTDDHQGRGIGGLLFDHLCATARKQGIGAFVGHVMPRNRAMRRLLEAHGEVVEETRTSDAVHMTVRLDDCGAGRQLG